MTYEHNTIYPNCKNITSITRAQLNDLPLRANNFLLWDR